jgi:GNAT superfamily N-acetyltransferase
MKIEFVKNPKDTAIEFLAQKINEEHIEFDKVESFAFFLHNEEKEIIGGCNGWLLFGAIYTDQLWVDAKYRRKGFGTMLLEKVHDYGRENGCKLATLMTMNFQKARPLYEKLGYVVDFQRSGYTKGSSVLFLKKNL